MHPLDPDYVIESRLKANMAKRKRAKMLRRTRGTEKTKTAKRAQLNSQSPT